MVVVLIAAVLIALTTAAPVPSLSVDDPGTILDVVFDLEFSFVQGGDATGYGPYVDLKAEGDRIDYSGLEFTSLGNPLDFVVLEFGAGTTVQHPYALDSSSTPVDVSGNPGDVLFVVRLPYASVVVGQPAIDVIASGFELLEDDVDFVASAGFRYGADSSSNPSSDPTILSGTDSFTVTLGVYRFWRKFNPYSENVGPSESRTVTWYLDIATGRVLEGLSLTHNFPSFVVIESINSGSGSVTTSPPVGSLFYNNDKLLIDFGDLTGAAGTDETLSVTYHVPCQDYNGTDVVRREDGDAQQRFFGASRLNGAYNGSAIADTLASEKVEMTSARYGKGASVVTHHGVTYGYTPQDLVEFTLSVKVSECFDYDNITIHDVIEDGQEFVDGFTPTATSSAGTTNFVLGNDFWLDESGVGTGTGETILDFDLSRALYRGLSVERIVGAPQTVSATYRTVILEEYTDIPSAGHIIVQGDSLYNSASFSCKVVNRTTGAFLHPEAGGAGELLEVPFGTLSVEYSYVNGGACPCATAFFPGDELTLLMTYVHPTTDFHGFTLGFYLPDPLLASSDAAAGGYTAATDPPAVGDFTLPAADTLAITPTDSVDANGFNSMLYDYGAFDDPDSQTSTAKHASTFKVTNIPYPDREPVSILFESVELDVTSQLKTLVLIVSQPVLEFTKGAVASTGTAAVFDPADVGFAYDTCPGTTAGVTVASLKTAPITSDISEVAAGDIVTFTIAVRNVGHAPAYDITLVDTIPRGFARPVDGIGLCAQTAAGEEITTTGDIFSPGGVELIDSPGNWNGLSEGFDPDDVEDLTGEPVALITYNLLVTNSTLFGDTANATTTLLSYSNEEGEANFLLSDDIDPVAPLSVLSTTTDPAFSSTAATFTTSLVETTGSNIAVGEVVNITYYVDVPRGSAEIFTVDVDVPSHVDILTTYVESIEAPMTAALAKGSPATTVTATTATFEFGPLTNPASSTNGGNQPDRVIAVTVRVALSNTAITSGTSLDFTATLTWFEDGNSVTSDFSLTAVKPVVRTTATITSSLSPDEGDLFEFTFDVDHPGASDAPVYDVVVTVAQPSELLNSPLIISSAFPGFAIVEGTSALDDEVIVTVPVLGELDTLTVTVKGNLTACTATNTIQLTSGVTSESCPADKLPGGVTSYTATDTGISNVATIPQPNIDSFTVVNSSFVYAVLPDVVVGEAVTYEAVIHLIEGYQDVVYDVVLPRVNGGATLEVVSSEVISLGATTGSTLAEGAAGTPNNAAAHDALDDEVRFDLGTVFNPGNNRFNSNDQVSFRVVARVSNTVGNVEGTTLSVDTTLRRSDETSVDTASSAAVTVREPTVAVVAGDDSSASTDADDPVTFTATVSTGGGADGFDTTVTLALPSYVDLVVGSVTLTIDGVAGGTVTVGNTGGDTTAAGHIGRVRQSVSTIVLTATGTVQANAPAHTPSASLAYVETYSTSPAHGYGEIYNHTDSHDLELVPQALASVSVRNSSLALTTAAQFNTGREDFAIGELVFYDASFTTMEGTSTPVVTFTFSDGSPGSHGIIVPQAFAKVSNFGADTSSSLLSSWDSGVVAGDTVTFNFGTVTNTPDNAVNSGDVIHFLLAARVINDAANVAGDQLRNTMAVTYSGSSFTEFVRSEVVRAVPTVDAYSNNTGTYVVAGTGIECRLAIRHTAESTAPMYDVVANFTVPNLVTILPGTATADDGGVVYAANEKFVVVHVPFIDVDTVVNVTVVVTLDITIPFNSTRYGVWEMTAASAPAPNPESETLTADTTLGLRTASPVLQTPVVLSTSWAHTVYPDAAVGETVTYSYTIAFPPGSADNVRLSVGLDAGLAVVSIDSISETGSLTPSEPNTFADVRTTTVVRADGTGFDLPTTLDLLAYEPASLTVVFTAVVLDNAAAVRGVYLSGNVFMKLGSVVDRLALPDVLVVEPTLEVTEVTNNVTVVRRARGFSTRVRVDHAAGSNAPAVEARFNVTLPGFAYFTSASLVGAPPGTALTGVGTNQLRVDATAAASHYNVTDGPFGLDADVYVVSAAPYAASASVDVAVAWRSLDQLSSPISVYNTDSYHRDYAAGRVNGSTVVDSPPNVSPDSLSATEGNTTTIDVTANDADVDGNYDGTTVVIVSAPSYGTATTPSTNPACVSGCVDYVPIDEYTGSDVFWYRVCDSLNECSTTFVNVSVQEVNDLPVVSHPADLAVEVPQEIRWPVPGISTTDVDEKGGTMTATVSAGAGVLHIDAVAAGVSFTDGTANGEATIAFDGTLSQLNTALAGLEYTGDIGAFGTDTLAVIIDDNGNTGIGPWSQRRREFDILVDQTEAVRADSYFYSYNLESTLPAGTVVVVYIQPVDKFGNNITAQYDTFNLTFTPTLGGAPVYATAVVAGTGTRLVAFLNVTIQGTYNVTVELVGDGQLPGSPVVGVVIEPIVYYKPTSSLTGAMFNSPVHAGNIGTAAVVLADRYGNEYWADPSTELVVRMIADGGTPGGALAGFSQSVSIVDYANGTFGLSFNSTAAGPYTFEVDVVVNGTTLFTLGPKAVYVDAPASHLDYTVQPPVVATAGVVFNVTVAARDRFGNYDVDLVSNIDIAVYDSDTNLVPVFGTVVYPLTNGDVRYLIYLTDADLDAPYTITATADGAGAYIPQAISDPFTLAPDVYHKPSSSLTGPAFNAPVHAGDIGTATVVLADQYGNEYWATPSTNLVVRMIADGGTPGGALAGFSQAVTIVDHGNGTFSLSFNATAAGPYTVEVDVVVNGTTLFTLGPEATYVDAPATRLVYTSQPPVLVEAGELFNVTLAALDRFGNYDVDLVTSVTLRVFNDHGDNIPIVGTTAYPLANGAVRYLISVYTADINGTYTVNATAGGAGSYLPFALSTEFVVEPGIYNAASTLLSGNGFVGGDAGETLTGTITLVDVLLNPAYFHPTSIVPHLTGNDGQPDGVVSIDRSVTEWNFDYSVYVTGSYDLLFDVFYNGSLIFQLGPYDVFINTTAVKLEIVTQPPGSVRVGDDFVVEVAAVDQWSNIDIDVPTHSIALALVSVEWPSAVVVNGAGVGGAPVVALDAGVASFTLTTVTASDPHDFVINAVSPGSSGLGNVTTDPFLTYARYPTYANSTVTGAITAAGDAGTDITGTLSLIDVFGNAYLAGIDNVNMTFELVGSPGFDTSSVVFPVVTLLGNGQYALSANITLTGDYSFTVNVAVAGGPALTLGPFTLTVNTVFTRLVWTLNPPATTEAGASFPLTVAALDDYGNVDVDVEAFDILIDVEHADSAAAAAAAAAGVSLPHAVGVTTVAHVAGESDFVVSIPTTGEFRFNASVVGVSSSTTVSDVLSLPTVYSSAVDVVNTNYSSTSITGEVIDGPLLAGATGTADAWLVDALNNGYAVPGLAVSATFVSLFDGGSVSVPVNITASSDVPGLYTLAMTPTVVGDHVLTLTVEELGSVIDLINATVTVHTIGTAIKTLVSPDDVYVRETFTGTFAIVDVYDNIDVDAVYDASVELVHVSGAVTPLNGVTTVPVVSGLAVYANLSSDVSGGPGETFTLRVTATESTRAGDLGPHSSNTFVILPLPASGPDTVVTHCALNADGGTAAGTGCTTTVELFDEYGNYHHSTNTSVSGVLVSNFGGADVTVDVMTNDAGLFELTYYTTVPGEYTLSIVVVDNHGGVVFTQNTARTVTVTATWLDIVTAPTVVVAGVSFDVVAVARDVYGNVDTDPHTPGALVSTHYGSSTLRSGVAVDALVPPHNTSGVFAVSIVLTVAGDYRLTVVDSQSDTYPAIAHDNRTFVVVAAEPSMTVSHASVVGGAGGFYENTPATLGAVPVDAYGNPTLGRNWTVTEVYAGSDTSSSVFYNGSSVSGSGSGSGSNTTNDTSSSSESESASASERYWSGGWVVAVYADGSGSLVSETLITLTNYSWPGHQVNVSIESVVEPATYSPGTYTAVIEYYGSRLNGSVYTFSTYEAAVEVVAVVAVDPDNGDNEYSDGDVILAFFNMPTNEPNVTTSSEFARVFEWNANMGAALSAHWTSVGNLSDSVAGDVSRSLVPANLTANSSVLVVSVDDATGATPPSIGNLTLAFSYTGSFDRSSCGGVLTTPSTLLNGSVSANTTNSTTTTPQPACPVPLLNAAVFSVAAKGVNLVSGNWGTFAGQQVNEGTSGNAPGAPVCMIGSISCGLAAIPLAAIVAGCGCCFFAIGFLWWRSRDEETEVVFVDRGEWVWVEFLVGTKHIDMWKDSHAWHNEDLESGDGSVGGVERDTPMDEESGSSVEFSSDLGEGKTTVALEPILDPLALAWTPEDEVVEDHDYTYWIGEYEKMFEGGDDDPLGTDEDFDTVHAEIEAIIARESGKGGGVAAWE